MNITATITTPAGYAVRLETWDGVVRVLAVRPPGEEIAEAILDQMTEAALYGVAWNRISAEDVYK